MEPKSSAAQRVANDPRKRRLYVRMAKFPESILLRGKSADQVFVVQGLSGEKPKEQVLSVPRHRAEVVGWFAGKEVIRLR